MTLSMRSSVSWGGAIFFHGFLFTFLCPFSASIVILPDNDESVSFITETKRIGYLGSMVPFKEGEPGSQSVA